MSKIYRLIYGDRDQEGADRQTISLAGLAVTLLLLVVCVWLTKQLHKKAVLEDCLLSGRTNCSEIIPKLP